MVDMYLQIGDLHSIDDTSLVNAIPSNIKWNRMNSNPTVRVICTKRQESDITFQCFPSKYGNKFYVGYVIKEENAHNVSIYYRGLATSGIGYDDIAWDKSDEELASVLNGSTRFTYTKI